jgi:uncharacterized protein DUF2510
VAQIIPPAAENKRPGWYDRSDMHQTLGFWDGEAWTDQTAPSYKGVQPSTSTIARGVVLGFLLVGFLVVLASALFDS